MDARSLLDPGNRSVAGRATRSSLRPAGAVWSLVVRARNGLYDRRLRTVHRLDRATVSVGNLSAGGTGKTPLVLELVRRLRDTGHRPAVLHRGYGGEAGDSDEQRLYRSVLPDAVPVEADPDRRAAAARVLDRHPDTSVFVLDDAFQHRRVHRDLDLVLVDASAPLRDARVLPAGLLREAPAALRRADAVVLTHVEQVDAAAADAAAAFVASVTGHPPLARAAHAWSALRRDDGTDLPVAALARRCVMAASGIGNPAAFEAQVRQHAAQVPAMRRFADHHRFDTAAVQAVFDAAHRHGTDTVVVTEKDWVKWQPLMPSIDRHDTTILRPVLAIRFEQGENDLDALLRHHLPSPGSASLGTDDDEPPTQAESTADGERRGA